MSLTIAKVQNYVEQSRTWVEQRINEVERAKRFLKDAEDVHDLWKTTLEKLKETEGQIDQ